MSFNIHPEQYNHDIEVVLNPHLMGDENLRGSGDYDRNNPEHVEFLTIRNVAMVAALRTSNNDPGVIAQYLSEWLVHITEQCTQHHKELVEQPELLPDQALQLARLNAVRRGMRKAMRTKYRNAHRVSYHPTKDWSYEYVPPESRTYIGD